MTFIITFAVHKVTEFENRQKNYCRVVHLDVYKYCYLGFNSTWIFKSILSVFYNYISDVNNIL